MAGQYRFPSDFVWGAATASYQIEGAAREDGRGESIWDRFAHTPGRVIDGSSGDVACDHYHRFRDDVALMRSLGLRAYRFSVAWPRVFPQGGGQVNEAGLAFYDRLVDALLEAGIQPYPTLYHWDLPQALQDQGGWTNRETAQRFADYAGVVTDRLGDRVGQWMTLNEPWVTSFVGHYLGGHAPGIADLATAVQTSHHFLLAHGLAIAAMRASRHAGLRLGIAVSLLPTYPGSPSDVDRAAAHRLDGYINRWFLDPIYRGRYPQDVLDQYGPAAPRVASGDMDVIRAPLDFLGVNYYTRGLVRHAPDVRWPHTEDVRNPDARYTPMDWEVFPAGLYDLLTRVHRDYAPPAIYITENGCAAPDPEKAGGDVVPDPDRVQYLYDHFVQAHRLIEAGVPLRGYFVWSLMDNYEWSFGYTKRFGLVHVDYGTQKRTLKASARWYQKVIQTGELPSPAIFLI